MIPRGYITEWKANAPWPNDAQVEQDLVIERALIALFSNPFLKAHVAFRGGTALHKVYLKYYDQSQAYEIIKEQLISNL